MKSVHFFPLEQ